MKELILVLLSVCYFLVTNGVVLPSIPDHLVPCYRRGGPTLSAPRRLDVFLSLLKKVELDSKLDTRLLATSLLKSLRLDGIEEASDAIETEFVLPYRASSFQFHKYKILMDLFLPSLDLLNIDEILPLDEKCLLHKMLSSTVRRWERNDENVVCPLSTQLRDTMAAQSTGRLHSRCPVEDGVIQTNWGPVAIGTIVAAVAASAEIQSVTLSEILDQEIFRAGKEDLVASAKQEWFEDIETLDDNEQAQRSEAGINNVWVATLAGDLAEVVINQGPRFGASSLLVIGSNNRWNDTLLPRDHYILPQNASLVDWQFTDAEILAGIDGLILSNYVAKWLDERRTLRLSQIIEMYYSNEGVSFDPSVRACDRQALFRSINATELVAQTSRLARVLSLQQISVYIHYEEMDRISAAAVSVFDNYLNSILRKYHKDCAGSHSIPVMDLVVATDGSWKGYDVEQFMSWVGDALEINMQRSTVGLLHGNTAQWIAPPADNLTTVFAHINNFTDEWPNRINIPNIISAIIQHERNKTLSAADAKASALPATVVLIVCPSDRPSSEDLERSQSLMQSLRASFYDVYFVYASTDLAYFQDINNLYLDYSELFLQLSSVDIHNIIESVDLNIVQNEIPTTLVGAHCPFNGTTYEQTEFEDFVLPGRTKGYRIHPFYLRQQPLVSVQFRNNGQGRLMVCTYRGVETSHSCQTLAERERFQFNLTTPCQSPEFCPPAHFTVSVQSTSNTCANTDCRLPNQVGYYIEHSGLACLPIRGSASKTSYWRLQSALSILISLFILS